MKPKRVAYVLNIFPKLSETFIAGEIAELRRRGIEVLILSLLPPRAEPQHAVIQRAGLDRLVEYDIQRFVERIRQFKPQWIHAHFAKEATEKARALSTELGVPFSFTAHGYDIHRKPPPDFHERAKAASGVVTVSRANAEYISRTFHVDGGHIHVIPCGVDTNLFRPNGQFQSSNPPTIVCVARLVAVKNLGMLLESCRVLRDRNAAFRCVMLGDGPLRGELEEQRRGLGLQDWVVFRGAVAQDVVLREWQHCDIGVLTSDQEGMPVSLMEAAACGVPVVATNVGGIPELVLDGVTGVLSPAGNADAFAGALERLLKESDLRRRLGAAARLRAENAFSVTRQADSLLAFWGSVLEGRA
jgi:glycosyltransferase involved in cell wall biosynthesis